MTQARPLPELKSIPVVPEELVRSLIDVDSALHVIEQAYADYGRTRRVLSAPPALLLSNDSPERAAFKIKGAKLATFGVAGFRIISDRITEHGGEETVDFSWVADASTGKVIGLVEATWLHRLRTALTGVMACKWLARSQSHVITIIGSGKIADEFPGPLSRVFDCPEIRVATRNMESARAFADRHGSVTKVMPFSNVREASKGADIIIGISSATAPVLHANDLAPGTLVCGMGGGPEIAVDVLDRADRFIVDDLDYALSIGSVHGWIQEGIAQDAISRRLNADIGEIALGAKPGRMHDTDVVLAIIQGMACCDLALANLVISRSGLGRKD